MKQPSPERLEKNVWQSVSFCCGGQCASEQRKLAPFPVMISACRHREARSIRQVSVQSQEAEIPTFCPGAASKAHPAQLIRR